MQNDILKAYKKREKALQKRISAEFDVNKRLVNILRLCENNVNSNVLNDMIKHEIKMLKYKYI